ncbi:unnamed protein product [Pleuronectes platessa]|uniref:Lebercilin domain-containing protein n=1 Tax=Pleuronectes platessa TaxID=8262 RepID=A0A9N7Z0Z8_PLEPL|nr:unnamed protein product [Pleuronectes platessa]
MDVKEQNSRKPVFALKRDCGNDAASSKSSHKLQGSKLSGEEKVRKTQGTVQSQSLKLPLNKPQQVSNPKTQCNNLICISELKIGEGNLLQQLSEVRNENKLLKTIQHYDTVTIEHQDAGDSISETITKCRNEVRALLRNTLAYRDQLQAKLKAKEDRLLNTKDPFHYPRQHSHDHNLWEREQLSSRIAQPSAEQQERNEDFEGHIQLDQAWFNRQVASGQKSNGPMCCYPHYREHQLLQDLRALGPVKSVTYETVQLEEQQVEQKEEQEDEHLEEQQKPQLEEQLEEVLEEHLEEQEDEQLEEQQENEQLEEQPDEQEEQQLEEQEEGKEDKQLKNFANSESSAEKEKSESPVASENPLVFEESRKHRNMPLRSL